MLEKTEKMLEWGGMKKDIICLAISGFALAASILGIQPFSFQMAWIAIILCGLPIILEAVIGLAKEFDIKADAVSYTHLDVYKRQGVHTLFLCEKM